jgi:hypothetical protein
VRASDPRLLRVAAEARVRPPHVFHCLAAIAEDPRSFDPASFALFAGLEPKHIHAIVAALDAAGLLPKRKAREKAQAGRLPADFAVPSTWKLWAQTERGWTPDVVETVAAEFVDYWHSAPNGTKRDWEATWRNWVRGSKRPNGAYVGREVAPLTDDAKRQRIADNAAFLARIGRG